MKRTIFDTLRRGVDNTIANWALIVIRVVEVIVFALIAVGAALAVLIPLFVSIGLQITDLDKRPIVRNGDDISPLKFQRPI